MEALTTEAQELLFGGASRGGKSFFVRVALILWSIQIPGLQSFIFRKHFDDVIGNHMNADDGFRVMLAPWVRDGIVTLTQTSASFANGSLISLEHLSHDKHLEKHQGRPKHVLVFDEATQIPERQIRFLRGWVTMSEDMKARLPEEYRNKFPKIIYTANPIGVSVGYFRRHFVKAKPAFEIFKTDKKEGGFLRQYIPSRVEDNPSENAERARERLAGIGDDAIAEALISGNWDAPIGDFFKQYDDEKHSTPDFLPPEHWFKFRTFDWGSSEPFCVHWWGVSDGEEFLDEYGRKRWFPRGALICYREWYGCDAEDPSKGLELRNEDIALGIVERTHELTSGLTVTDNLPFQDRGMSKNSKKYKIADVFAENGVPLLQGNTARIHGWSQLRARLIGIDEIPTIYFCESCVWVREYLPAIGRHPTKMEDAEESGEATHAPDSARLACTTRPIVQDMDRGTDLLSMMKKPRVESVTPNRILSKIKAQGKRSGFGRR